MIEIKHRITGKVLFSSDAANLRWANLRWANLSGADLTEANLYGANLSGADLSGADLYKASLTEANLTGANLSGANLTGANLCWVNLYQANLRGAYLSGADLSGANLYGANLSGADLSGAYLSGADLYKASLTEANLTDAKGLHAFRIVPDGALVGWKKVLGGGIVELAIPRSAKRVNAYGSRKCRAEYAVVVAGSGASQHDSAFMYAVGATVRPDKFDPDPRVECSHGIHFFLTREEAEEY